MIANFSMNSFVAGVMSGALLTAAWFFNGSIFLTPFSSSTQSALEKQIPESGAISVANQSAGMEVIVESVTVPPPGVWVAVREVIGNNLGNVLGATRVTSPRSNLPISLLRATEPSLSYAVQLYRANGDGVFDLTTDSVYIDFTTGMPVIEHFTATN